MAILHQPHSVNKKIKRVSRLVILPDYQGIGLGTKFLNKIAEYYIKRGYDFSIVTSAKNLIYVLKKSDKWLMYNYAKSQPTKTGLDSKRPIRSECYTGRFMYKHN